MCLKILREDIDKLGRKKDFFIIDDEDQLSIVKDIFREHNINQQNIKPLKMLQLIGYIKMNQINLSLITSLDQLKPLGIYNFNDLRDVKFAYKMYQSKLIKHNGLDFEDLLILTYELLSKFALVRQK
jgi:DNA helicase-2/ATP-dependent DNA helicase PcrA